MDCLYLAIIFMPFYLACSWPIFLWPYFAGLLGLVADIAAQTRLYTVFALCLTLPATIMVHCGYTQGPWPKLLAGLFAAAPILFYRGRCMVAARPRPTPEVKPMLVDITKLPDTAIITPCGQEAQLISVLGDTIEYRCVSCTKPVLLDTNEQGEPVYAEPTDNTPPYHRLGIPCHRFASILCPGSC